MRQNQERREQLNAGASGEAWRSGPTANWVFLKVFRFVGFGVSGLFAPEIDGTSNAVAELAG